MSSNLGFSGSLYYYRFWLCVFALAGMGVLFCTNEPFTKKYMSTDFPFLVDLLVNYFFIRSL
jgi:hypothetical protein